MSRFANKIKTTVRESLIIMKKDLKSYFISPIAYIVIVIFLIATGVLFFSKFFLFGIAELRYFFGWLPIILSFIIPAITMRLFAEERNTGAFETLVTMPVTTGDIIAGKILAASFLVIIMLIPTLMYPALIAIVGELEIGPIIGGYLGTILLGAAFSAIGVLTSSFTKNQIIAFLVAFLVCLFLSLIHIFLDLLPVAIVKEFNIIGINYHFQNIAKGVIDSRNILYFLSIIAICWFSTVKIIDERR